MYKNKHILLTLAFCIIYFFSTLFQFVFFLLMSILNEEFDGFYFENQQRNCTGSVLTEGNMLTFFPLRITCSVTMTSSGSEAAVCVDELFEMNFVQTFTSDSSPVSREC